MKMKKKHFILLFTWKDIPVQAFIPYKGHSGTGVYTDIKDIPVQAFIPYKGHSGTGVYTDIKDIPVQAFIPI
jgi:hypothetical protein